MISLHHFDSGSFRKGTGYQYFMPSLVNDQWEWQDNEINDLLERAAIKLGELNSFAKLVPNIDLFLQLHVVKEAVVSSKIEGTQTNIGEAFLPSEEVLPERRNDWKEVNNYIKALNHAISELDDLPISTRLIRQTHKVLLTSVRGEHKMPGEFRRSQNWIGGMTLSDATFIPPDHHHVMDLMSDLEQFIHNDEIKVPILIRAAIIHYQFETIHPFLDGNGRIGRLLITLYLVSMKVLNRPLLYLSSFFEADKGLYFDNLTFVRTKSDMKQWIKYFLVGIEQTANQSVTTLTKVLELKAESESIIISQFGRRANNAMALLQRLFDHPYITVEQAADICNLSFKAANDLVALMVKHNLIEEWTGQKRNRFFVMQRYLQLFE